MENHHDEIQDKDFSNAKTKKRLFIPIIALAFTFMPTLILILSFIPFIGNIFAYLFMASFWSAYFHIIGVITGVIYLISQIFFALWNGRKQISIIGFILSIISILVPIVRWSIIISLYNKGSIELFL